MPPVPEVRQDGGRFPEVAALSIIPEPSRLERRVWIIISLLAVATGIFFRFRGFATWPLATDEYYIFRAMTFVLSGGLPEFPCGGYYSRGLLYQYITAPLLAAGIAPEAALRTVSILSNLAMLPAAWLLAHRLGGLRMAAVAVTILALSVWEIEMARFGRMYAPFQTLFLWYLYHLYNLMVTGEHRRWRYLIALSFAGPLVWEGGVILPVLNFIPLLAGTRYWLLRHGAAAVALLVAALVFASINFRTLGPDSAQPPLADGPGASGRPLVDSFPLLLPELPLWAWLIVLGLPLLGAMLVRNHWRRLDFRAWLALAAIAGALLLNQLLLAAMVAIGAVLIRWLPWSLASGKPLRWAWLALGGIAVYWAVYALVVHEDGLSLTRRLRLLIGFPDLYSSFAYPWLSTDPLLIGLLVAGVGLSLCLALTRDGDSGRGLSALLLAVLLSLLMVGGAASLYHETRYSFFFYPLLVILALYGFSMLRLFITILPAGTGRLLPVFFLGIFAATSDLSWDHLRHIDSYRVNFRLDLREPLARHYYTRYDYVGTAHFINRHAAASTLVITTSTPVTHYLSGPSTVYLDRSDSRYVGQACDFGRMERWSGDPLLGSLEEVEQHLRAVAVDGLSAWIIADALSLRRSDWRHYLEDEERFQEVFVSGDNRIRVFLMAATEGR